MGGCLKSVEKKKVKIYKILRYTPVGFHAWVDSNVGIIKKETKNIKISTMNKLLEKFQPADVIAIIITVGSLCLIFCGIDGLVGTLLLAVIGFYFGKKQIYDKVVAKVPTTLRPKIVEGLIREIAQEEKVDPDLAVRVAKCESNLDPNAKNTNTNGSVDRGLYQWNSKYHPEITDEVAFDLELSTKAFCKAVKEGHLDWWNASKNCWNV